MIFIVPLNKAKQIKTIFKVLILHINSNKLTITISILKRLIIKLLVYLILLLFYKTSPNLIDILTYFTPNDTSIISMSVEEYDQWIKTLSDCNLPTYEESIFNKPLPNVPNTNPILNIIKNFIDSWK